MERTELPAGWHWTTIGEIASAINSGFPSGSHNQDGDGVPHLRPMNVSSDGVIDLSVTKYVPDDGKPHDRLKANDVLFNNTNSPVLLGKTAAIKHDTDWAYSNHMTRIRLKADQATGSWVAMCLHFLFRTGFFMQNCRNHVNQASINSSFLANEVWIPLPSLSEQHRIIEIIETQYTRLDAAVMALKRVQANLRRYRAAVLKAACEGRLVPTEAKLAQVEGRTYEPAAALLARVLAERRAQWQAKHLGKKYKEPMGPDVSALPELPEGWCWATLEIVASQSPHSISSGPFGSALGTKDYRVSGIPVIRGQNIRDGEFLSNNFVYVDYQKAATLRRSSATAGDLVIVAVGSSGNSALVPETIDLAVLSQNVNKVTLDQDLVCAEYVLDALRIEVVRQQMKDKTTDVVRSFLSLTNLKKTAIPLPPLAEQKRVSDEVDRLLSLSESLDSMTRQGLARTARLRQSILQRAFSGNLT